MRVIFQIPKIESPSLLNDLEQTSKELSQIIENFEKSVNAIDHASWSDVEKFVKFNRMKKYTLGQLDFIKRKRVQRDVKYLRVEREHAMRFTRPDDTPTRTETRTYLLSLTEEERESKLAHALENRNSLIIETVMHWPHYLVGVTEAQHTTFCEQAKNVLRKDQLADISAAEKELKILSTTLADAIKYVSKHEIMEDKVA